MAPHTRFKLATIRTMRCDFCNKGNVDGLQECADCNMHVCRGCVETGKLNNDERHRLQQNAIDHLNWDRGPRHRRATHRRTTTTVSESASAGVLSKEERRQAKIESRLNRHSDHGAGTHTESASNFRRLLPKPDENVETLPSSDFNVFASNHEQAGHVHGRGPFQQFSTRLGYPPGYVPSFPNHAMPHGAPSFGPGQHGQQPSQGGLAMPSGPMYGHHFSVNPGLPPRGDPRIHTPPGQQFAPGGYPVPNNFGGYLGVQPMAYSPAPTPPGFAGPMFHQHFPQPPAVYNDRGYVPRGNMPTGQPGPGPVHFTGLPYGGGAFPQAARPLQEQCRPFEQEGERTQGADPSDHAELARGGRARAPSPHEHAEQPAGPSSIERKHKQQQTSDREQPQQAGEQQQARQEWERQQTEQVLLNMWQQWHKQHMQQTAQPVAEYQQSQERDQGRIQPPVKQESETAQQAQKQNEQRQEQPGEQQSQQQAVRPIPEGGAVSGPSPLAAPNINAPHITAPPFTLPPITAPPITAPRIAASSVQEAQAPHPDPAPPLPTLEPDPNDQLSRLHLGEAYSTIPSVVGYAQRPFGIPALARDLFAGRPNHYDETAARWAQFQSAQAQRPSQGDEEDDDETESETGGDIGNGKGTDTGRSHPGRPSDQPPNRGRKRTFSQTSSAVDSTLSAELDQPVAAAAAVPGTEALRRKLRTDADIARERREGGERAALDMAAAANTLQGGGRGLGGVADAQVVANDREIQRRQQDLDRKKSGRGDGAS